MRLTPRRLLALACGLALLLTGCAGTTALSHRSAASPLAREIAVVKGWSNALRRGEVARAARYFALPSAFVNGGAGSSLEVVTIRTRHQALVINESLPCGATFLSAERRGRYLDVLFRLGARRGPGGGSCGSGTESSARTDFLIAHGKIVEWLRAPSQPGDPGTGTPGTGTGTATGPTGTGTTGTGTTGAPGTGTTGTGTGPATTPSQPTPNI